MHQANQLQLSVLLATRNNATGLRGLLTRLGSCIAPESWEIVIVDNGSTDATAALVKEYADRLPVRYFFEGRQGKSRALNLGILQALGELILFTDDDIVPDTAWLINHIDVMQNHAEINVVGGRINVDRDVLPAWLRNSYNLAGILVSEHDLGDTEIIYPPGKYPYGPNMSVRRSILANIQKPWPEHLGPGTRLPVGDEVCFVDRVSKPQVRLYSPNCRVEHRPVFTEKFFTNSVKRCFQGGYVAGYYAKSTPVLKAGNTLTKLASNRIQSCQSVREFVCVVSRAVGYYGGRCLRRFDKSRDI